MVFCIFALFWQWKSRNNIDDALQKYKEVAVLNENCAELWNNIGLCFFKKRKIIMVKLLQFNDIFNNQLALLLLGFIFTKESRVAVAIKLQHSLQSQLGLYQWFVLNILFSF